jgi:hypothetical protein
VPGPIPVAKRTSIPPRSVTNAFDREGNAFGGVLESHEDIANVAENQAAQSTLGRPSDCDVRPGQTREWPDW